MHFNQRMTIAPWDSETLSFLLIFCRQEASISLRPLIPHAENNDVYRFSLLYFFLFVNSNTMLHQDKEFLPWITAMFKPHFGTTSGHTGLSQVDPAPTSGVQFPSKTSQKSRIFSSLVQAPLGSLSRQRPLSSPFSNQSFLVDNPQSPPNPRGTHSIFSYVNTSIRWDFCFVYSGAFHLLIFKIALQISALICWF